MPDSVSDQRVANLVGAFALHLATAQLSAVASVVGMSGETAAAITALAAYPGERVGFFAPILGLTSAGTVRLIGRLERRDLVERSSGPDGRSHAVRLTASGETAARRIREARATALATALAPLDPGQLAQLGALLEPVLAAHHADRTAARRYCRLCDHAVCDDAGACPVDDAVTAAGHPRWHDAG